MTGAGGAVGGFPHLAVASAFSSHYGVSWPAELAAAAAARRRFDTALDAHGTGRLPADIIDEVIGVCDDVLAGRTDDVPCAFAGHKGVLAKARRPHSLLRQDGGCGNVFYCKNRIV